MMFQSGQTAQIISAKKKARQEKWWIFPVVLLLCVLSCLAGIVWIWFSYAPHAYLERDVDAYVRSIYGDGWTLQKKSRSADGAGDEYLYEKEGDSFSVFSVSVPVYRADGVASGHYRRGLYDNYFSTVIEKKSEDLEKLAAKYSQNGGPKLEISETGETAGAYGAQYTFCLYLNEGDQIEAAADLLARLDALLAFTGRAGEAPYADMRAKTPCVEIYLKPDGWLADGADAVTGAAKKASPDHVLRNLFVDWRSPEERDAFRISRIPLTDAAASARLAKSDVLTRLENDYVDAAKTFGRTYYKIPQELWNKYPAPVLTLINAGGHDLHKGADWEDEESLGDDRKAAAAGLPEASASADMNDDAVDAVSSTAPGSDEKDMKQGAEEKSKEESVTCPFTYQLVYHRATGTYWMIGLDPCEDFDGNPFGDYPRRGAFAWLVKCLGGSCTADRWTGKWRIGTKHWEASLQTQKTPECDWVYRTMTMSCDGNRTPLDAVPDVFEGTGAVPSGRPYSIRDLIRMFDVRVTINQKDMTAVMFRDFGTK